MQILLTVRGKSRYKYNYNCKHERKRKQTYSWRKLLALRSMNVTCHRPLAFIYTTMLYHYITTTCIPLHLYHYMHTALTAHGVLTLVHYMRPLHVNYTYTARYTDCTSRGSTSSETYSNSPYTATCTPRYLYTLTCTFASTQNDASTCAHTHTYTHMHTDT